MQCGGDKRVLQFSSSRESKEGGTRFREKIGVIMPCVTLHESRGRGNCESRESSAWVREKKKALLYLTYFSLNRVQSGVIRECRVSSGSRGICHVRHT